MAEIDARQPKREAPQIADPLAGKLGFRRKAAAELLDCSEVTVWRMERSGILKSVRIGGMRLITVDSLRAVMMSSAEAI